jgi:hypothetical protein
MTEMSNSTHIAEPRGGVTIAQNNPFLIAM